MKFKATGINGGDYQGITSTMPGKDRVRFWGGRQARRFAAAEPRLRLDAHHGNLGCGDGYESSL